MILKFINIVDYGESYMAPQSPFTVNALKYVLVS